MSEAKLLIDGMEFHVNTLRLQPGDKLVISTSEETTAEHRIRITREARELFGCQVVVLPCGHNIEVLRDDMRQCKSSLPLGSLFLDD